MIQTVPILCMPSATDVCQKCGKCCTDDYWKCEDNYLCHACWFESSVFKDRYTKNLKKYKVHSYIHIFKMVFNEFLSGFKKC